LFGGYHGIPRTIVVGYGRDLDRKSFNRSTRSEIIGWLASHKRNPDAQDKRTEGVVGLLDDLAPFFLTEETTVEEAIAAKRNSQELGSATG
jgi:hypothetical protein